MPLKDILIKASPRKQKNWLGVCEAGLDKEDFEHLMSVMHNEEEYSGAYIARIMTKQGFPVSATTVQTARRNFNG